MALVPWHYEVVLVNITTLSQAIALASAQRDIKEENAAGQAVVMQRVHPRSSVAAIFDTARHDPASRSPSCCAYTCTRLGERREDERRATA